MQSRKAPFSAVVALSALFSMGSAIADDVRKELTVGFSSDLLVSQGQVEVTHADVDAFMQTIPKQDRAGFLSSPQRIGQLLTNLILVEAMALEAMGSHYIVQPEHQTQLYRVLVDELSKIYRNELFEEVELDDYSQRARELYLANPDRFREEQKVDFYHVLVTVGNDRSEAEAMQRIAEAWRLFRDGELGIEEVVSQFSEDPNREENGGLYTGVPLSELERAIATVLSEMTAQVGISEPLRTPHGWHLVQLHSRADRRQLNWEEAKDQAKSAAREDHMTQTIERKLREFQQGEQIFAPGAIQRLLDRYDASFEPGMDASVVEQVMEQEIQSD